MAHFGKSGLSADDISQARGEEVEKLIPDSTSPKSEDEDFFLRGPQTKKSVRFTSEKFKDVQVQIAEVTDVMRSNVGRLLERGDQLDQLQERSDGLASTSDQFRVTATQMQRKFFWQNLRSKLWVIFIFVVIILIIVVSDCDAICRLQHQFFWQNLRSKFWAFCIFVVIILIIVVPVIVKYSS